MQKNIGAERVVRLRVVCAMSGGVDSSVAALLLQKAGHDVIGVTLKLWECFKTAKKQTCCSAADAMDARRVCEQLGIPHHTLDLRDAFREHVVEYFVRKYSRGRTPNPCIVCNSAIKFGLMREECLRSFGTDVIATGHYARIEDASLLKGVDPAKDQSYFLWGLTRGQLSKTLFPVGGLTKADVRKLATEAGIKTAEKRESQEICFIPDDDYAGFMHDFYPQFVRSAGNFVDKDGKVLGRHNGIHCYTLGQRRGLGFGVGRRQFVVGFNIERNEIVLGEDAGLMKKEMAVEDVNWLVSPIAAGFSLPSVVTVKIRYKHVGGEASVILLEGGRARVEFKEPQRAITPGQAAVFYDSEVLLGGGWIAA
jgi:tRNA-specific 2-thiouridylase